MPRPTGPKGGSSDITPGGLERVYAYLTPEAKAALRKLAYERRSSISALVVEAVDAFLEEQSRQK